MNCLASSLATLDLHTTKTITERSGKHILLLHQTESPSSVLLLERTLVGGRGRNSFLTTLSIIVKERDLSIFSNRTFAAKFCKKSFCLALKLIRDIYR